MGESGNNKNKQIVMLAALGVVALAVLLIIFMIAGKGSDKKDDEPSNTPEVVLEESSVSDSAQLINYKFRSKKLLDQHYEKHGIEMGFDSAEEYQEAASAVVNNPEALHKTEKEDGDYVFYLEATHEFVIVSTDGYLRTYFLPSGGKKYYDKQ